MKNVKIYPKRIAIVVCMFLAIPVVTIVAKVADIHIPSGEEINMVENASDGKANQQTAKEQEQYYNDWHDSLPKDEQKEVDNQNEENSKKWVEEIKEDEKIYNEYKDKWTEQPPRKIK